MLKHLHILNYINSKYKNFKLSKCFICACTLKYSVVDLSCAYLNFQNYILLSKFIDVYIYLKLNLLTIQKIVEL